MVNWELVNYAMQKQALDVYDKPGMGMEFGHLA
jgi:hypothetical protein